MYQVIRFRKRFTITVIIIMMISLFLGRQFFPAASAEQVTEQNNGYTVYLTFDDGPSVVTDEVLQILQEKDVKATFFVTGATTDHGVQVYQQIIDDGHAIGLHSYTHDVNQIYLSADEYISDFKKLDDWLFETVQIRSKICRMPGGSFSSYCPEWVRREVFVYFEQEGYRSFDWNIDAKDAEGRVLSGNELLEHVQSSARELPNRDLVILMHDDTIRTSLPKALPQLIDYFKELGYSFGTLEYDTKIN